MSDKDAMVAAHVRLLHAWFCGESVKHGDKGRPYIGWACERGTAAILGERGEFYPDGAGDGLPSITDDPDYYPNTDYERGYADGRAALAAPPSDSLDVERLARAIWVAWESPDYDTDWLDDAGQPYPGLMAEQIAAEYAALAPEVTR